MRSLLYPILGAILGIMWFVWPFVGGAVPEKTFVKIMSGVLYVPVRCSGGQVSEF